MALAEGVIRIIQYDPEQGALKEVQNQESENFADVSSAFPLQCLAAKFDVPDEKDKLSITVDGEEKVVVRTMHLSCKSDTYQSGHKYGGVIIYQYNDKSDWRTANGTHCKSGYVVIQDTDSENVRKWTGKEPGAVHGAVYRSAFGESVREAHVVGEGFSYRNKFEMVSRSFNKPENSKYHDKSKDLSKASAHCVRKIVDHWKEGGSSWASRQRNFEVKKLLEDY